MSSRSRWVAIGLVVAAAACSDIASPVRTDLYEWRLVLPKASGIGNDTLSFHWPKDRLPVRIWAEDAANLTQNVPAAIEAWRAAFLYKEFDATVVGDSSSADVIFLAGVAPPTFFSIGQMQRLRAVAPECTGATDVALSDDHTQVLLPIHVYINPHTDPNAPNLPACLALTTTHELGHALGIWRHSSQSTDLMFMDPVVTAPSPRDVGTAEVLYHVPSNVEPVGR
jgi:predicted Zn-dependent protease